MSPSSGRSRPAPRWRVDNARLYGEAREQERASGEARALLDALVTAAPIGQGFLDTDFRYMRVNDALAEINGVPAIEHVGRSVREVLPAMATEIEAALTQVLATGEAIVDLQVVGETPREPGRARHYLASYYRVALPRGERLGVGVTVADVTDRAEAAQALREQRDLYETLHARAERARPGLRAARGRAHRSTSTRPPRPSTGRSAQELYALPSCSPPSRPTCTAVGARLAGVRDGREPAEPFRTEIQRPTAPACRSRWPAGGSAPRWPTGWWSSGATSPSGWRASASCSACSRSSGRRAAPARPRTPACGCWPTPARCSSGR